MYIVYIITSNYVQAKALEERKINSKKRKRYLAAAEDVYDDDDESRL